MKLILRTLLCMRLLGASAPAAEQTWTGQISDSMCGDSHAQMITVRNKDLRTSSEAPDRDCTLACIKDGAKYVFVVEGKVYKIANQQIASIQAHAGQTVRITGNLRGDSIKVSNVAPSAAAK